MDELPQPDLMDQGGRLRRLIVSLLIGAAVGALAYSVANAMANPDNFVAQHKPSGGAFRFVF